MSSVEITPDEFPVVDKFADFGLHEGWLRGIYSYGFETPGEFQKRGIMPIVDGRDTILQAKSGAGKTATYTIGILQQINVGDHVCQALVFAPTREMATYIQKVVLALGDFVKIKCHTCPRDGQHCDGQHCVVGTPGSVIQMVNRRHLRVEHVRVFVLDAADEMLSRGFRDQIYETFRALPGNVQVCLCSTTQGNETVDLTMDSMRAAVQVWEKQGVLSLQDVRQFYVAIEKEEWKLDILCDLGEMIDMTQAVVYCNSRRKVDFLEEQMTKSDFRVLKLHSGLDRRERDSVMRQFRAGFHMLISTDMDARGFDDPRRFDAQSAHLVINYDLPPTLDNYLPRVGKIGVGRHKRVTICFVTNNDVRAMKEIERYYQTQIEEMPMDIADVI